jgi:hypothetical protein
MTPANLRLAQAAMAKRDTKVSDLCAELGVTRQTQRQRLRRGPTGSPGSPLAPELRLDRDHVP